MTGASCSERKAQYLDMARTLGAAADSATDDSIKAQYLDLASKWIRLADELSRRPVSMLHLVGADDLPGRDGDDDAGPRTETSLQRQS